MYVTNDDLSNVRKMVLRNKSSNCVYFKAMRMKVKAVLSSTFNLLATLISSAKFILGNYNHGGFYRVNYDQGSWLHIIHELETRLSAFTPIDRAGILDDAFTLARGGYLNYSIPLNILKVLENDTSHLTWKFVFKNLGYFETVLNNQEIYSQFRRYKKKLLGQFLQPGKKVEYLSIGCTLGQEFAVKYADDLFNSWMVNGTKIPVDIRSTVYSCGVQNGGDKEWQFIYEKYVSSNNPIERSKLQNALSASQKPWLLEKWLQYSLDSTKVRSQDTVYVIGKVAEDNFIGKYVAWKFAFQYWPQIIAIAKENNFHVGIVTSKLTSQFTTKFDLDQVELMWKKYPKAGSGKNARKQGLEKIKSNILWLEKNYSIIEKWLKTKS